MKLELIRNAADRIVGYKLVKESTDDSYAVEYVRDMIFYGLDDRVLTYDGRTTDKESGDTIELRWVTKSHEKIKRAILEKEVEELVNNKNQGL